MRLLQSVFLLFRKNYNCNFNKQLNTLLKNAPSIHLSTLELIAEDEMAAMYFKAPSHLITPQGKPNRIKKWLFNFFSKRGKKTVQELREKIASGNCNPHIEYSEAQSVEEAIQFGKDNGLYKFVHGVKQDGDDLAQLNEINETLCNMNNNANGTARLPKTLRIFDSRLSADGFEAAGSYSSSMGCLSVKRNAFDTRCIVNHEIGGHGRHSLYTNIEDCRRISEMQVMSNKFGKVYDARITEAFLNDHETLQAIDDLGILRKDYAKTSPAEAYAELRAAELEGIVLPDRLNRFLRIMENDEILHFHSKETKSIGLF